MPILPDASWPSHPFCFYDFETTGLDVATVGVVSVGCVRFEGGREVGSFYSLVNPLMSVPEEASKVHGIRDEHVKDAPFLEDLAPQLYELAKDAVPGGYNVIGYDAPILRRFISGDDCPMFDAQQPLADVLVVTRDTDRWERGAGRHRLENVCKRHGVELGDAHNALSDARACGELLFKLLDKGLVKPCPVETLLSHIAKRAAKQDADFKEYLHRMQQQDARREASSK